MDRRDYFLEQAVTEGELDQGFDGAEDALWDLAVDIGLIGVSEGLALSEDAPPSLTVLVTSGTAHTPQGKRIRVPATQELDASQDENGVPTTVQNAGNERWITFFAAFDRALYDERIDGASQQVFFARDESYALIVRQGAEAPIGTATKPGADPELVLLADVLLGFGQATIEDADFVLTRRDIFLVYAADQITFDDTGLAHVLGAHVQAALEAADAALAALQDATGIGFDDTGLSHIAGATVDAALSSADAEIASLLAYADVIAGDLADLEADLSATTGSPLGAAMIGVQALAGTASYQPTAETLEARLTKVNTELVGWRTDGARRTQNTIVGPVADLTVETVDLGANEPAFVTVNINGDGPILANGTGQEISPPHKNAANDGWQIKIDNQSGVARTYRVSVWSIVL